VAQLRPRRVMRLHPCGADSTSCGSGGTRDVATGRSGWRTYAGRQVEKRGRVSSLSALHNLHGLRASRGYRGGGRALDWIISDSAVGWNIANRICPTPRNWASARSFVSSASGLRSGARRAASGCKTGVHRLPIARTRGRLRLRQRRSTLIEDSKQGLHNRFFTGGGWT
jgi:hypothetical protein